VQLTVFFVQETALSLLYIWQARKYLRNSALLSQPYRESPTAGSATLPVRAGSEDTKRVLLHLVFANTMVIALDVALLGVQYADLFYLQGAFKPCVYGVKLKVEFAILNRLVEIVRTRGRGGVGLTYPDLGDSRGGVVSSRVTGGGGPHPRSAGQSQPQIHVSRIIETKWEDHDGNVDDNVSREQIGLENLEQPPAKGSPRSQSHESQRRIWDGQGPGPADGGTEVEPSTTGQQAQQWRQVYHR
jgi:hypothetical protein